MKSKMGISSLRGMVKDFNGLSGIVSELNGLQTRLHQVRRAGGDQGYLNEIRQTAIGRILAENRSRNEKFLKDFSSKMASLEKAHRDYMNRDGAFLNLERIRTRYAIMSKSDVQAAFNEYISGEYTRDMDEVEHLALAVRRELGESSFLTFKSKMKEFKYNEPMLHALSDKDRATFEILENSDIENTIILERQVKGKTEYIGFKITDQVNLSLDDFMTAPLVDKPGLPAGMFEEKKIDENFEKDRQRYGD